MIPRCRGIDGCAFPNAARTGLPDTLFENQTVQHNESSRWLMKRPDRLLLLAAVLCLAFCLPQASAFPKETLTRAWGQSLPSASFLSERNIQLQQHHPSCLLRLKKLHVGIKSSLTLLEMAKNEPEYFSQGNNDDHDASDNGKRRYKKGRVKSSAGRGFGRPRGGANATGAVMDIARRKETTTTSKDEDKEVWKRMTQLEQLVARQTVEIRRLQDECRDLKEISSVFAHVLEMLRASGLDTDSLPKSVSMADKAEERKQEKLDEAQANMENEGENFTYEYFDDTEIFGEAPSSVTDAADAAGAAVLAGLLGGKQRMLVDVRDSELSRDSETLVNFIELAILPVAAGLEGLHSKKNRVKIVFPTVSQLLEYRRTMALSAPEVVALSTLGFDPVEERDNIVVIVAPSPDNDEGLKAMNELLEPEDEEQQIEQPVVVLNHHMVPLSGPAATYDVMYHLRLLSVQYMSGDRADDIFSGFEVPPLDAESILDDDAITNRTVDADEELLEAAMKHAQEVGVNRGVTRAMVIRSYPTPWHVFVDVSPATDADFVVAATFDTEPGPDDVNNAIVECLEGSEQEDEIVAQQMAQQALEFSDEQINQIMNRHGNGEDHTNNKSDDKDDDDIDDDLYDLWNEDSV